MPSLEGLTEGQPTLDAINNATAQETEELTFPPVTKEHILNCSYDSWFTKYRTVSIRSRIIKLSPDFVQYIRDDGIILADDDEPQEDEAEEEWSASSNTAGAPRRNQHLEEDDSDDEPEADCRPPNERFPEIHHEIKERIKELGGAVAPKLNWSAPKDAAWISPHQNTLKCTTPNDIYLLLKSSSFVSHDLEHAFEDTVPSSSNRPFQPVLVLRPFFSPNPALEFRCFVKHRTLIGLCQRDWNYYPFLDGLRPALVSKITDFFEDRLRFTFPDGSFTFDVYVPGDSDSRDELGKVRLIDINPWAPRTDSLLYSWVELLEFKVPGPILGSVINKEEVVRIGPGVKEEEHFEGSGVEETTDDEDVDELVPELRLVEKDNPAAFNFSTPQYSAHKLPKEVVEASMSGDGGLREFAQRWKEMTEAEGGGDVWENPPTAES
ncbi:D123-domain-containing protein [Colletotrichum phormii]|uniref:D123-domain-containing protein n=1 Tax=Colletotrichum phormii TaxID=359342 RepID=A0AAJ0EHR7_9PEZI|nr:D123-domain-containing protein [Colletotrichum phormii]KAK1637210.1 D123-domain-containing protein [Colletotrichum phormii]